MVSRGMLLGGAVVAGLALAAVALMILAEPAEATIIGKPFPTGGIGDWVIDQDTQMLNEQRTLKGNISVTNGYSLYMKSVTLSINSTNPAAHGIIVEDGGELEMEEVTIKSDYGPNGWYFEVWGDLNIHDKVKLSEVQDGIGIYTDGSDRVTIDSLELYAQGMFAIYIDTSNPSITNSDLYLSVPAGATGYGIYIYGFSGGLSTPVFKNLYLKVSCIDKWTRYSSVEYEYMYLYGLYADGAYFNPLSGIEITFEARLTSIQNASGTARLYVYMYTYGIYLTGPTQLHGMSDVVIRDGTYDVNANAEGGINQGTMYFYSYFYGFYNRISSNGLSTDRPSGLTVRNHMKTYNGNNIFANIYDYNYGYALYWYPMSTASTDITFTDIELSELDVDRVIYIPSSFSLVVTNCRINMNDVNTYLIYFASYTRAISFIGNEIRENSHVDSAMFYGSSYRGKFTFEGNLVEGNTYYEMFRMDNNYDEVKYVDNTFRKNKEPASGSNAFFYMYYTRAKTTIEANTFQNNTWRYFIDCNNNRGTIDLVKNDIIGNTGSSYLFWSIYLNAEFTVKENDISNNSFQGGFFLWYNYKTISVIGNTMMGNQIGTGGFIETYYYIYGSFKVEDNWMENNTLAGSFFKFSSVGYSLTGLSVSTQGNTFIGNIGSTATNSGLFYFEYGNLPISVTDNYFEGNEANCVVVNTPYTYGTAAQPYGNNWFYIEDNEFYNNKGKCVVFLEVDGNYIQVRQNKASGNEDYFLYMSTTKGYLYIYEYVSSPYYRYIYMYGSARGPKLLRIENNNISNNPGGGIYAITSTYDATYSYYNPGNPSQEIIVKSNFLEGNGKDGWALLLKNLYKKPSVKSNSVEGSAMGEYYGLIGPEDSRRVPFTMEYRDLVRDGGANGLTAFGFEYVDATFYECSLLNYTKCLYADNCEVNAYWSAIPEGGGETKNHGRIRVWNHLSMRVTWANATGVDSGEPVSGAIVTMRGFGGAYTGAQITKPDGTIIAGDEGVIKTWESIDTVMYQYAPWNVTILANNATTGHTVHVIGDYMPPNYYPLTLWDMFLPEVIISNPQEGTLVSTADVLGEGFLFERGSGIAVFEAQTDQDTGNWTPVYPNVLWTNIFKFADLPGSPAEGAHNLSVRSKDISGNWNSSTISIIVDKTDPDLEARLEFLDGTPVPYDPVKGGFYVRDKEIALNGTYGDNFSPNREIIIRVNGVAEWIPQSMLGRIYKRVRPDQGINTYIIDATDQAGRRTSVRLYVSLDSYAPTMYIYSPLQGDRVGNSIMTVVGLTEPNTVLHVLVTAVAGERSYDDVSEDTGNFAIDVELFEGIQKIIVTAIDSAANPTQVSRDVTLKTSPPDFEINAPPTSPYLTKEIKYTIIGTMTKDPDSDVYINGQKVVNTGVFRRTLVLQEGDNPIEIKAIDKVGNEKTKYVTITRDTIKPVLEVLTPEGDYLLTNVNTVLFTGTSQIAERVFIVHKGQEYAATLVSGTWATKAVWSYTLTLADVDLDQIVEVKARDKAGNEVVHSVQVVYDVIPPLLRLDDKIPTTVDKPRVQISGETDENVLTVYIQGIAFAVTGGEFTIVWPLVAGENSITVSVMDDAGNPTERTLKVTYNAPPPPPPPPTEKEGLSSIYGWILIVAAITIIGTAFFVTSQKTSRGR